MTGGKHELGVVLMMLRELRGWDQTEMAAAAGVDQGALSRYENGHVLPRQPTLEKLAAAVSVPLTLIDGLLLPAVRAVATLSAAAADGGPALAPPRLTLPGGAGELTEGLQQVVAGALGLCPAELAAREVAARLRAATPAAADRSQASAVWRRLAGRSAAERRWLAERLPEMRTWAMAELLCHESAHAAARDAGEARELAGLALWVAEVAPAIAAWRSRLCGYCRAFVANALRVDGQLPAAEATLARAWELWRAGDGGDPAGLLGEWRLLDLEASLRRAQRQFQLALALLDRAAAVAPAEALGRVQLKRASTLEQAGDAAGAVRELRAALPLIEGMGDARLRWVLEFNLAVNLCHLGSPREAEERLPLLRRLAVELGNGIDLVRVEWLSGRVADALGRKDEARAVFERVRQEFTTRHNAYDTALVSLELAILYLDEGRTAEVRQLADAMRWIFAGVGIEREALAALRLFCAAARQERVTPEEARQILAALRAAQPRAGRRRRS
jgi:DNA-binding XRE family transcriptional regulator/tetratricopeptide (TPR) repeat protein